MKKNEYSKYFFAAVGVAIAVFVCVGIILFNYSVKVKRELYETSSRNLNEVYTQVSEKFMQITQQQWKLLGMTGDFINEADENVEDVRTFLNEWKNEWHYTEFYFIDDDCNYLSSAGKRGYLELGNTWKSLVVNRESVIVDGSLPGSDEVMFFAIPVEPAHINGFSYSSIAVSYNTENINKELGVKAFAKDTSSYIVYANGDVVLKSEGSMDTGGNIFYHLKNADFYGKSLEGFMQSVKDGESGEMEFTLDNSQYYLVYVPVGFDNWGLISMVPIGIANSSIVAVQQRTVWMAIQIAGLLLIVAVIVLYTYYRRYVSEKNHEISRRDILFSIMAKNLDDVYIMLSWGDWRKLYVSRNVERVLGLKNNEYSELAKAFGMLDKKGEVPDWKDIARLKIGESVVNEYWIKPANSNEYRLFKQGCYHMDKDGDDVLVIILSDRTYEQQIRGHMEDALHTAEAANLAKSQFLANMSHDIRTPMNAIVGFSQLLLRHEKKPEKVKKYAEKIVISSQHLLSLINDVLDMSKIESGKTTLNLSDVNVADIVQEIDNIIRPQAKQKNQTFIVRSDNVEYGWIKADKLRLNQILLNILSNAVKYTPEGGTITFEIRGMNLTGSQFARYKFEIADNGIGMSDDYIKEIFKPFTREANNVTDNVQGTGLGMAITKNLIDLMGGTIKVNSKKGEGSTFEVTMEFVIPDEKANKEFWDRYNIKNVLVVDDEIDICENIVATISGTGIAAEYAIDGATAVSMVKNADEKGTPYDIVIADWKMPGMDGIDTVRAINEEQLKKEPKVFISAYEWGEIKDVAREAGVTGFISKPFFITNLQSGIEYAANMTHEEVKQNRVLEGKNFLVAEDNVINAEMMREFLKSEGATCDCAKDGMAAVDVFSHSAKGQYDMIFMDVQMPNMDGYEATRTIRQLKHPDAKDIPIVAMTANAFSNDVKAAFDSGMNAHMAKPIDAERIRSVVGNFT